MIITVASNKGGVGKSTTAIAVAAKLAESAPWETILIDTDQQGHAALALGLDARSGLFDWLVGGRPVPDCMVTARSSPGLMLLPGDSRTKTVQMVALSEPDGRERIVQALRDLPFRYVVIDTAAGGLLQEAALSAADAAVIPVRPEHLGVDGLNATLSLIERIGSQPHIRILPTAYDRRLSEHRYNFDQMVEQHGDLVHLPIPSRVAVAEAIACGQTVWEYRDPALREVCEQYAEMVAWVRSREDNTDA